MIQTTLPVRSIYTTQTGRYVVVSPETYRNLNDSFSVMLFTKSSTLDCERKLIGRLPPDRLDATAWDDSFHLPEGCGPEDVEWVGGKWVNREEIVRKHIEKTQANVAAAMFGKYSGPPLENPKNVWGEPLYPNSFVGGGYTVWSPEDWKRRAEDAEAKLNVIKAEDMALRGQLDAAIKEGLARQAQQMKIDGLSVPQPILIESEKPVSLEDLERLKRKQDLKFQRSGFVPSQTEPSVVFMTKDGVFRDGVPISQAKKETPNMFFKFFKSSPKFLAFVAAAWLCGNATLVWNTAKEWWTAPTRLEIGDWVQVRSCDSCRAVVPRGTEMCPKCGGEAIHVAKAQELTATVIGDGITGPVVRGHIYPDGTVTTVPGHWLVPEREVKF